MAHIKRGETRSKKQQQRDVLAAYEEYANISRACKKAKIPRRTFYHWLTEIDFKAQFVKADEVALGVLEDEAARRALQGTTKPVYYKGNRVGGVKEYSDTLTIVLLKARAPQKYKERFAGELSGEGGKDLTFINFLMQSSMQATQKENENPPINAQDTNP